MECVEEGRLEDLELVEHARRVENCKRSTDDDTTSVKKFKV